MAPQFSKTETRIVDRLVEHGQEHVLRWVEELSKEARRKLMQQLAHVDFDRLDHFNALISTPPTDVSFTDVDPPAVARLPLNAPQHEAEQRVQKIGQEALEANRVAIVTVAGGQGTRLGYDHPKGMYPITPIRGKSLFQLFAEEILSARRRYSCKLPWLIMTSPTNDEETRAFFWENSYFGLGAETVHFFVQQVNPIISQDGKLLLAEKDQLLAGPDGHGGTFDALAQSGLLEMLRNGGWDLISYFQVDNPLVTLADQRFIGHHLRKGADFSCKVVPKRDPSERLGIAVLKGEKPVVIEYVDVPPEVAGARTPNGKLRFRYGSIAVHVMDVPFVERVVQHQDGLPWHIAKKQYEILDDNGEKCLSPPGGCYKFERFIFDALEFAEECAFVEVRRDSEFAPVKNAEGDDSPESARRLMQRRWLQWLQQAGAEVRMPRDFRAPQVEISSLYASDAEELKERVEPGWKPSFPLVLEP
jgi:UDP-N-acetylglucosamine/UDP-N-acetylgalactosamine diphosphorylase